MAVFEGHCGFVCGLAALDFGCVASASYDETVQVWDYEIRECWATFEGHRGFVSSVVALEAGRLASGSGDNTIKIWDCHSLPSLTMTI